MHKTSSNIIKQAEMEPVSTPKAIVGPIFSFELEPFSSFAFSPCRPGLHAAHAAAEVRLRRRGPEHLHRAARAAG